VKYELQIVSLQAEKDKHEIESERARLRSLIGNVAHDLKTPLQSIGKTILRVIEVD
jgi:K+-sensing histidine kinase KdpD